MSEIKDKSVSPKIFSLDEKNTSSNRTPKDNRDPKKLEAARMFENQFIRQMIGEMRKTIPKDGIMEDSMATNIFSEQLDDQYADKWVENGGTGLADMIYGQLEERYGKHMQPLPRQPGEMLPIKPGSPQAVGKLKPAPQQTSDLIGKRDKDLFLLKKTPDGFHMKSREALPEKVEIKAPFNGKVLQATSLGEGRQMIILGHDQGLKSQFVHTGQNSVERGQDVVAGQPIAVLPASRQGELANVFFGLRNGSTVE